MKAIVTGVSSGIGQAIKSLLEEKGWEVVGLTHKELDLSDLSAVSKYQLPKADALIHVAGVWHSEKEALADKNLEQFSPEQIIETMNVGVTSFMVLAAKVLPSMSERGTIIGVSGTFNKGAKGWLPYYTSKRALEDFLVGLSQDYPKGPRVYGISPADTATPAYKKFFPEYATEAQEPEAVAKVILELLEGSEHKTGTILKVREGKVSSGYHV